VSVNLRRFDAGDYTASFVTWSNKATHKAQRGLRDFMPAIVNHQRVTAVGHFNELRDADIVLLHFVGGFGDGAWHGVSTLDARTEAAIVREQELAEFDAVKADSARHEQERTLDLARIDYRLAKSLKKPLQA
jgi:hypothetical protein